MCARFVNQQNRIHQDAVKYLCCYLHYTQTRGLILMPTANNRLNAYIDRSDFAGQLFHATCQLRDSAVSRTGYAILYCGCPIHWVSKLQSEIALSTTKAEYIALSMCLCDLLSMCTLLTELLLMLTMLATSLHSIRTLGSLSLYRMRQSYGSQKAKYSQGGYVHLVANLSLYRSARR